MRGARSQGVGEEPLISREYARFATPAAYLIDEAGIVAADVATGVEPIRALLAQAAEPSAAPTACRCARGQRSGECGCGRQPAGAVPAARNGR